ncbi:hypothetical protein QRX60_22905 [Amycolatopsis mongoliensis]|uniref:Uncharacterized protein n=1 Tax=Amycolatopsis mongoliensis TaxID=715475 RepID=A0A9Y2NIM7_9PSEU|nr:hypothetical protein [Amycolatopsis sp. 4-36]WIY06557.1 hypothetical protein QRX60_22905 [Amycolatopsis sp. 4-36]
MTETEHGPLTPDAPRPPGTPEVDLDVDVPEVEREEPGNQDADEDAGVPEPPS